MIFVGKACRIGGVTHFGQLIRKLIASKHLTLRQFAAACGLSLDTINRVLKMSRPQVTPTTYRALAAGLGLLPEELDALLMSGGSVPGVAGPGLAGRTADQELEQIRRQLHATIDLLDREGLLRVEEVARRELRRRFLTEGATLATERAAAKLAMPERHVLTHLPTTGEPAGSGTDEPKDWTAEHRGRAARKRESSK